MSVPKQFRYSVEHKIEFCKYHWSGKSTEEIANIFAEKYPNIPVPHRLTILGIVRKFEETGSVENVPVGGLRPWDIGVGNAMPRTTSGAESSGARFTAIAGERNDENSSLDGNSTAVKLEPNDDFGDDEYGERIAGGQQAFEATRVKLESVDDAVVSERAAESIRDEPLGQNQYQFQYMSKIIADLPLNSDSRAVDSNTGVSCVAVSPPEECGHCSVRFSSAELLAAHVKYWHEKEYRCDRCRQVFVNFQDYSRHSMAVHSTAQPLVCDTCGKQFQRAFSFLKHCVGCDKLGDQWRQTETIYPKQYPIKGKRIKTYILVKNKK